MAGLSFSKPAHRAIALLLQRLDVRLFTRAECYFAGGTAIVLMLNEYRESRDVDFLCASAEGYRLLRAAAFDSGLAGFMAKPPRALREMRADQYGIRAIFEVAGAPIKFEIVREARIGLAGSLDPAFGVPLLARSDLYAEKLLAIADRGLDRSVLSRDLIDLCAMQAKWGATPAAATLKAENAYGKRTIAGGLRDASRLLAESSYRQKCFTQLRLEPWAREAVESRLRI